MPYGQYRLPILPLSSVDGPAVTAAALTDGTPLPAPEIPGQFLQVGGTIYITAAGRFTSTGTPGTIVHSIYMAKSAVAIGSAVSIVASSAIVPLASQTNKTWMSQWEIQVVSLGAGGAGVGQVRGSGRIIGVVAAGSVDLAPATAPYAAVSVDTTANQRLLYGLTPSVATGSVTIHDFNVEYGGL